ncbi:hypothetical protein EDD16DRAFT_1708646 [Pisolithus croceorrhizus]|nr:hypothetical protein EDD16DRAFT_1708646 [Pisolithus croceorrhizus]
MQYPNDRDLLTPPLSLSQFVNIAHQLGTRPDGANKHVQFVMASRQNQRGTQYIVRVNPLMDEPDINPDDFTFIHDYDSIIGFSDNLPFRVPLGIFLVPPFNETLKKESHITGLAYDGQGEQIMVPLHKVPNFALGKVAQRSVTHVFFPRKYIQDAQATITQNEFEVIYDECLRPAIEELLPESTA